MAERLYAAAATINVLLFFSFCARCGSVRRFLKYKQMLSRTTFFFLFFHNNVHITNIMIQITLNGLTS
uniref:RE46574p n=1 Tax=Drosophila melanogaster TaxID=7227 RepID=Q6NPA3_DROME|nr:RE46574p [Drosophila melanogaster]